MDNVTLITIISLSFGFIIVLLKMIFKSKCELIDCCCCIKIKRDIKNENDIEKYRIDHNIKDEENLNINSVIK